MSSQPVQPNRDPSGNTEAFRAFTQLPEPAKPPASKAPLIIGGVVAAAVVIAVLLWLALS